MTDIAESSLHGKNALSIPPLLPSLPRIELIVTELMPRWQDMMLGLDEIFEVSVCVKCMHG